MIAAIFVFILVTQVIASINGLECNALKDGCGCLLDDDSAMLDLGPMKTHSIPMFSNVRNTGGAAETFQIDLCRDMHCTSNTNDSKVCGIHIAAPVSFGRDTSFEYNIDTKIVTLVITKYVHGKVVFTSRIVLKCGNAPGIGEIYPIEISGHGSLFLTSLTSKHACWKYLSDSSHKRISIGSWLCIILLALLIIYFAFGILINKFALHKEGTDIFPNKDFWSDLPSLTKEGCVFTYGKLRKKDEYAEL